MREPQNPFQFGRELSSDELVDRDVELGLVERTIANRGKLFLIGPRRYGKTSILSAAEQRLTAAGAVILRYDAEAYESLELLAQALLTGAARKLAGPLHRAGEVMKRAFGTLRPEVSLDVGDQKLSVTLRTKDRGAAPSAGLPVLTDVLNGIEQMAADVEGPVAVILDEFQQVIAEGGAASERQVRAAIQTHRHVGYVFAGSKTRLLADMTGSPARAFWKLGDRHFVGPIPRADFAEFLRLGFEGDGHPAAPEALDAMLDLAQDVPYNVQRLAYTAWELLRVTPGAPLTADTAARALEQIVAQENPAYAQLWNSLTTVQKKVLKAVILEGGRNLTSTAVLQAYGLAASTMHKTLRLLDDKGVVRDEERGAEAEYRLEDPFLGAWLRRAQEA